MRIHSIKAALAVLGLCLSIAVAGPVTAADAGIGESSITLGMSGPFSGPSGPYGAAQKEGALAYFAQLNAAGGINGRKIELVTLDDAYDTTRVVANTHKLIDESKVFALMGYYGSTTTTEAMKVFTEARVPLIGAITGADSLRNPVNHYTFLLRASYADETEALVNHLVGQGITSIAVFYQNDGYGKSGLEGVNAALARHKLKLVAIASVERNSVQVEAAVRDIARATPQAVIMLTLYKPTSEFVRQLHKAGQRPQLSTLSPIGNDLLVSDLGAAEAHGIGITQVMPYPWNDTVPVVREYQKALQSFAKHKNYSYFGLEGYINARLIADAIRKSGKDLSREKLISTLEGGAFDLGGYKLAFTPSSHSGSRFVDLTVLSRDGRVLR